PDAWCALTDLSELINVAIDPPTESAMFERTNGALCIIASFSGLAQENMSQLAGWRFLELGRRIERAIATCRFVRGPAAARRRRPLVGTRSDRDRTRCANPHRRRRGSRGDGVGRRRSGADEARRRDRLVVLHDP